MKNLERASILLTLIGIAMKLLRLAGGNELVLLGLTFLSMVYFYLGFALINNIPLKGLFKQSSYASISTLRIMAGVAVGGLLSIIVIGVLFKLLILTGATEMLIIGDTGLVLVVLAAAIAFIVKKKSLDEFYRNIFVRGGIAVILGITAFSLSTSSLIRFYYRDDPAYAEMYVRAIENPYDQEIQNEFEKAQERRDEKPVP